PTSRPTSRGWLLAVTLVTLGAVSGAGYFLYNRNAATIVQTPAGITISRLTNGIEPQGATISPDGKYFVYHESGPEYKMWLQQTGYSSRAEIIPASEKALCCITFSPDAEFIYYLASDSSGGTSSLYRVPTLGGPAAKILTNIISSVSFSPDGREIVYSRYDKQ